MAGTPQQRAEFTMDVPIHVEHFRLGHQSIGSLIDRAGRTDKPGGLWIFGDGGSGKSFLLKSVVDAHPPHDTETNCIFPVLMITLEGRVVESELLAMLLMQLGCDIHFIAKQSNADLRETLIEAIKASGVRLVIFDEAHHLWGISASSKKTDVGMGGQIGNTIKRIYDATGVAFVFAAIYKLKPIVDGDPQLFTRWLGQLPLQPFADDAQFRGVLMALDEAIPMPERGNLAQNDFASQLHQASAGYFRVLKTLLAEAVYIASLANAPRLEAEHFRRAYANMFCAETTPFDR